jgi:hypothetical protein
MAFQSTVFAQQGFGVVGDIFDDGPHRAQPFTLRSDSAADNVFGRAFTVLSEGVAEAGKDGTQRFAGILVSPKEHALVGNGLEPSLVLPNETVASLLSEGSAVVALPATAAIGDVVIYENATGILKTLAPGGTLPANHTHIPGSYVDRVTPTAVSGYTLAVITLSPNSRASETA